MVANPAANRAPRGQPRTPRPTAHPAANRAPHGCRNPL